MRILPQMKKKWNSSTRIKLQHILQVRFWPLLHLYQFQQYFIYCQIKVEARMYWVSNSDIQMLLLVQNPDRRSPGGRRFSKGRAHYSDLIRVTLDRTWNSRTLGMAIAARIPIMAMTIINSMRVKPFSLFLVNFVSIFASFNKLILINNPKYPNKLASSNVKLTSFHIY